MTTLLKSRTMLFLCFFNSNKVGCCYMSNGLYRLCLSPNDIYVACTAEKVVSKRPLPKE